MKLKIEIQMDNAAFDSNDGPECARILRNLARQIDETCGLGGYSVNLRDVNGNQVGYAKVTK